MYVYINNLVLYYEAIKTLNDFTHLGLDIETYVLPKYKDKGGSALDPHSSGISLLQLIGGFEENIDGKSCVNNVSKVYIFDIIILKQLSYDPLPLLKLLVNKTCIGVYLQFDLKFIFKEYGIMFRNVNCLKVMSQLIGNATGSKFNKQLGNSFKSLCLNYLNIHLEGKGKGNLQTTDWSVRPTEDLVSLKAWEDKLKYASDDVIYLFPIWSILKNTLCNDMLSSPIIGETNVNTSNCGLGMKKVFQLDMQMIPTIATMEYWGMPADYDLLQAIEDSIKIKLNNTIYEISQNLRLNVAINPISGEPIITNELTKVLNSTSKLSQVVGNLLKYHIPNTTNATLRRLSNLIEAIQDENINRDYELNDDDDVDEIEVSKEFNVILDYRFYYSKEEKLFLDSIPNSKDVESVLNTLKLIIKYKELSKILSQSLLSYINPITGRIHSTIDINGAATGRLSSRNCNIQSIDNKLHIKVEKDAKVLFSNNRDLDCLKPYADYKQLIYNSH